MSYIVETLSLMSRPSASSTFARPRLGWCRSTTYEPRAYDRPASRKPWAARVTRTPLASRWPTRRAADVAERCADPAGITYARGKSVV